MSVVASDLVIYGAATIAESDGSTHGGLIDTTVRYVFDDSTLANTLNDTVEVLSSAAGDTSQDVTITGRNTAGVIVSETLNLNGTSQVAGTQSFERILKIVIAASHTGTVTVRKASDNTTIAAIESGVLEVRRPFYNVSADVSGGSARDFYEKVFIKNNNSTNALLGARIIEQADPSGKVTFNLDNRQNSAYSVASRLNTAPSNQTGSFDSADKNLPDTDLLPGSGQGIWLKLSLGAGDSAAKSTYTIRASGSTT